VNPADVKRGGTCRQRAVHLHTATKSTLVETVTGALGAFLASGVAYVVSRARRGQGRAPRAAAACPGLSQHFGGSSKRVCIDIPHGVSRADSGRSFEDAAPLRS